MVSQIIKNEVVQDLRLKSQLKRCSPIETASISNFGEAESRKADTLTGIHYDTVGRWRHFRPVFMFKHPKRKVYLASRLNYHPNSNASFNLTRLALCGDKNPNPGPDTSVTSKSKCKHVSEL